MWEFFEQLLSQLPSREFIQGSVVGAVDRAIQSFRASLTVANQQQGQTPKPMPIVATADEQSQTDTPKPNQPEQQPARSPELTAALASIAERLKSLGESSNAKSQVEPLLAKLIESKEFRSQSHEEQMQRIGKVFEFLDTLAEKIKETEHKFRQSPQLKPTTQPSKVVQPQPAVVVHKPTTQPAKPSPRKTIQPTAIQRMQNSLARQSSASRGQSQSARQSMRSLQRLGRRMQMWGGRLSAMPGRLPSMAGRGLARAGMALQGFGRAGTAIAGLGTAGVVVTGFVVAIGSAVAGIAAFVKGSKAAGEGLLEQQRRFASMSMGQSQALGMTTLNQLQNDIRTAQGTEVLTLELAREMNEFRDAMQPLDQLVTNLELAVVSKLVDASTAIVNGLNGVGEQILALIEEAARLKVRLAGGNQQMQDAAGLAIRMAFGPRGNQPIGTPIEQILRNLRNPPQAAGRPPIQPIP